MSFLTSLPEDAKAIAALQMSETERFKILTHLALTVIQLFAQHVKKLTFITM
jgi:hypothetical protein